MLKVGDRVKVVFRHCHGFGKIGEITRIDLKNDITKGRFFVKIQGKIHTFAYEDSLEKIPQVWSVS